MLMSKAEYARHMGVSRQTVYDWVAKGALALSGSKIDVEESERMRKSTQPTSAPEMWPHRTIQMTWGEFWEAIKSKDGTVPAPANDQEAEQRVREAAAELNWSIEFLDGGGLWLDDGDTEYFFQKYDLRQNAERAIALIRREVCYVAQQCPDDQDSWSPAGMLSLSEWGQPNSLNPL